MREADIKEIWYAARVTPEAALLHSRAVSERCWTVEWEGRVVMMFGVSRSDQAGVPWMLASDDLKGIRKAFLRECHDYVDRMQEGFPVLANRVWVNNKEHIRWLQWLGFEFLPPEPFGPDGEMFMAFYRYCNGKGAQSNSG